MNARFLLLLRCWLVALTIAPALRADAPAAMDAAPSAADAKAVRVYVIPVRDEINAATLYIVRRGVKEAIAQDADAIVFDMKTPGGALDKAFDIMEAIGRFPGTTITYVNTEAMSAGAFISATTSEIWFAPEGIIGAAAPVTSEGKDVEATMKQKIVSYLKARVRAMSEGKGYRYRGEVISAMIDADYELKIGDTVLKPKGELLSLTASEAAKTYGDPPHALLSAGTAKSVSDLIAQRFPGAHPTVTTLHTTWSEDVAVWLNRLSPVLLGLGLLALFIEFKTPGFGVFGITGIACLAVVFLGNYVAGLSGHEPMVVFGLGIVLIALELFFFPGTVVLALSGLLLMFGSLVWSMADLWPNEPLRVAWSADVFLRPLENLALGVLIAVGLGAALARFIPKGWFWQHMAVAMAGQGSAQLAGGAPVATIEQIGALIGRTGVAATALFPSGQVEIDGQRYEARLAVGFAPAGTKVVVRGVSDFGLTVEVVA